MSEIEKDAGRNNKDGVAGRENDRSPSVGSGGKCPESLLPTGVLLIIFCPGLFFVAEIELLLKLIILLVIWWGLLFFFWISPVFCHFEKERNWFFRIKSANGLPATKILITGIYLLVFWPIRIPKQTCFYLFVFFGIAIAAAKKFYF